MQVKEQLAALRGSRGRSKLRYRRTDHVDVQHLPAVLAAIIHGQLGRIGECRADVCELLVDALLLRLLRLCCTHGRCFMNGAQTTASIAIVRTRFALQLFAYDGYNNVAGLPVFQVRA